MNARLRCGGVAAVLAVAWLLSFRPGEAAAHPRLVGRWSAPAKPAEGLGEAYEFAPGEYCGGGVWRGCFTHLVFGFPVSTGIYELRMGNGTYATIGLRENPLIATTVANVDLGERVMTYQNLVFHP